MRPNPHYTTARKIRKSRVTGVYTTHAARKMRRRETYRTVMTKGVEVGKDVLWGGIFFVAIWTVIIGVVIAGLLVIN